MGNYCFEETGQTLARLKTSAEGLSQTEAAARRDFSRVAKEYFETDGELLFKVEREKNLYRVQIGFSAVRVKNFTPLK